MTTRIDNVYFLRNGKAPLTISSSDVRRLVKKYEDNDGVLPETCFLRNLGEELGESTKEKVKCKCGTTSYGNAKFCRECGTPVDRKSKDLEVTELSWEDDTEGYNDATAANTFFPVFVKEIVPCLRGFAECGITFGENQDEVEDIEWQTAFFVINNGELTWGDVVVRPGADEPRLEADDLYNPADHDDDEDEDNE